MDIAGGASTVRQALAADVIDELTLDIAPVLLGSGERIFDGVESFGFEPAEVLHSPLTTHIRYRRVSGPGGPLRRCCGFRAARGSAGAAGRRDPQDDVCTQAAQLLEGVPPGGHERAVHAHRAGAGQVAWRIYDDPHFVKARMPPGRGQAADRHPGNGGAIQGAVSVAAEVRRNRRDQAPGLELVPGDGRNVAGYHRLPDTCLRQPGQQSIDSGVGAGLRPQFVEALGDQTLEHFEDVADPGRRRPTAASSMSAISRAPRPP